MKCYVLLTKDFRPTFTRDWVSLSWQRWNALVEVGLYSRNSMDYIPNCYYLRTQLSYTSTNTPWHIPGRNPRSLTWLALKSEGNALAVHFEILGGAIRSSQSLDTFWFESQTL